MKRSWLIIFVLSSLLATAQRQHKVIAYYTGNGETIRQYPIDKLTHIIFSFLRLQNDTLVFHNVEQQKTVEQLVELKKNISPIKDHGFHRRLGWLCSLL